MYQLYYSPGACSMAVHIILEEVGAQVELTRVLVPNGETTQPPYLAINPKGRVPALAFDGELLTEVPAVLTYLALSYPSARLLPADPLAHALTLEWLAWLASEVHPAFGQIWRPARSVTSSDLHADVQARGRENVADRFADIEARLARGAGFAAREDYTIADPYLFVFYQWGRMERFDMTRYPAFSDHAGRVASRPATQRALVREGLIKAE
jgi:glutathione S-transferase